MKITPTISNGLLIWSQDEWGIKIELRKMAA